VVGLMDVRTAVYQGPLDLTAGCRTGTPTLLQASRG
jgi:hypothetical protein